MLAKVTKLLRLRYASRGWIKPGVKRNRHLRADCAGARFVSIHPAAVEKSPPSKHQTSVWILDTAPFFAVFHG